MIQLIITVITIALTAAMLAATVNYLPFWYRSAADIEAVIRKTAPLLEQAYDVTVRQANGAAPAVTAEPDGGLMTNFGPVLKIAPAAPNGFSWKYGGSTEGGGLHYFCLEFTSEPNAPIGAWKGVQRAAAIFSKNQYIVGAECGAVTSTGSPSVYPAPLAVTYYVAYTPGITK